MVSYRTTECVLDWVLLKVNAKLRSWVVVIDWGSTLEEAVRNRYKIEKRKKPANGHCQVRFQPQPDLMENTGV